MAPLKSTTKSEWKMYQWMETFLGSDDQGRPNVISTPKTEQWLPATTPNNRGYLRPERAAGIMLFYKGAYSNAEECLRSITITKKKYTQDTEDKRRYPDFYDFFENNETFTVENKSIEKNPIRGFPPRRYYPFVGDTGDFDVTNTQFLVEWNNKDTSKQPNSLDLVFGLVDKHGLCHWKAENKVNGQGQWVPETLPWTVRVKRMNTWYNHSFYLSNPYGDESIDHGAGSQYPRSGCISYKFVVPGWALNTQGPSGREHG